MYIASDQLGKLDTPKANIFCICINIFFNTSHSLYALFRYRYKWIEPTIIQTRRQGPPCGLSSGSCKRLRLILLFASSKKELLCWFYPFKVHSLVTLVNLINLPIHLGNSKKRKYKYKKMGKKNNKSQNKNLKPKIPKF